MVEERDLLLRCEQGHVRGAGLGGERARAGGDARPRRLDLALGALDARAALAGDEHRHLDVGLRLPAAVEER